MTLVSPNFFIVGFRSDLDDPISRDLNDLPGDQVVFLSVSDLDLIGSQCKFLHAIAYQGLCHMGLRPM